MASVYVDEKVQILRDLHADTLQLDCTKFSIKELLQRQAQTILAAHRDGIDAVTFHLGSWSPVYVGRPRDEIMSSELTLDQAQETISREYGYSDWAAVEALGDARLDIKFEQAVDYVITGQVDVLSQTLENQPSLVGRASQYPHRATLLHYIAANGVESYRQITPLNAVEVTRVLLEAGADVNAVAEMYGGGSTTLGLLLTSAHPAKAGVVDDVAAVLKLAGAK